MWDPSRSPASSTASAIESSYSTSSFCGLVSSKRRWHVPPLSAREAEIEDDRLRVAEMQVAVRLGRKARAYPRRVERARTLHGGGAGMARPVACREFTGSQVRFDHLADEVRHRRLGLRRRRTFGAIACTGLRHADAILRYAASSACDKPFVPTNGTGSERGPSALHASTRRLVASPRDERSYSG